MEFQLIFNVVILFVTVLLFDFVNKKILIPAKFNKTRNKLFALRDNLAFLAMKGVISEDSKEYIVLMDMVNNSIEPLGKIKLSEFISYINFLVNDRTAKRKIDSIVKKMNSEKLPVEYRELFSEFVTIMSETYNKYINSFEVLLLVLIVKIFGFLDIKKVEEKSELICSTRNVLSSMNVSI